MPTTQSPTHSGRRAGEQIASEAKDFIEDKVGRENLDAMYGVLQTVGDVCLRGLRQTSHYARRHPVQFALGIVAIGFVGSLFAKSRMKETLH